MTLAECCRFFQRSRFTISAWCKEKILIRTTFGRNTLISRASAEKFQNQRFPKIEIITTGGKRKVKRSATETTKKAK